MFDPNDHLISLKGKMYLTVQWRLVWFRDQFPHGSIQTEMIHLDLDKGIAIFKAIVSDGQGGTGVGHGSESLKDFGDYIEKAETKSIGRALATLGFGTQFAFDLEEGQRIVDSPVEMKSPSNGQQNERTGNHPSHNGKTLSASTQSVPGASEGQVNGKNGHPHSARLNEVYVKVREAKLASNPADFLTWVGSLFPDRAVRAAQDISLEMLEYLEVHVSPEQEAAHA